MIETLKLIGAAILWIGGVILANTLLQFISSDRDIAIMVLTIFLACAYGISEWIKEKRG